MSFKVLITRDFEQMSAVGADIVIEDVVSTLDRRDNYVMGLATGNSPTGLYKLLAKAAGEGKFDPTKVESFNLDEYVGLPGENAQQRALHPESYSFFMIQELFGLLPTKFKETNVPWGTLIDQDRLEEELKANPNDWEEQGKDNGKAIVIRKDAKSSYLSWVRDEVLDSYAEKIEERGGIDLHIVGVGGKGHVAFHESGIPFEGNRMLLVRLDDNTVSNAVEDGHFSSKNKSPWYAISMGAELVYQAKKVVLLASGKRKAGPVAESLLNDPSPMIPISYGQVFSNNGGEMIYVIDVEAAEHVVDCISEIEKRGIEVKDISNQV
ncbi:MAG: 6-phosphogluconolactonase [Deltaproteobacteria bacterium]|nr:6-phosphogluconolactonase [Deltaproteobacteria bacterium]